MNPESELVESNLNSDPEDLTWAFEIYKLDLSVLIIYKWEDIIFESNYERSGVVEV